MKKLLVFSALLVTTARAGAVTEAELDSIVKTGNVEAIRGVVRDEASPFVVRYTAFFALDEKQRGSFWNDPVMQKGDVPQLSNKVFYAASRTGQIPLERYPDIIANSLIYVPGTDASTVKSQGEYLEYRWELQKNYVVDLMKAGKGEESQSESKRLLGLCPPNAPELEQTVKVISQAVRAGHSKQGLKAAIQAQNDYLAAIAKNDLTGNPYLALPFPTRKIERRSALDDLYNGDYEAVIAWGDTAVNDPDIDLSITIGLVSRAWNGRAQLPTAANEYLKTVQ